MLKNYLDSASAEFVEKIDRLGGKPIYELTPEQARQALLVLQKNVAENPDVQTDEYQAPLANDKKMTFYIIKPKNADQPLPIVFYIHGGGWVMGGIKTHRRLVEELALRANVAIVFPEYELSPEAQYPQITEDLFMVLRYIAENAENFDLNAKKTALAGDSAGGNMAAVLALRFAKRDYNPEILFQMLLYPVTGANFSTPSYEKFADGPWLTRKAMEWFWNQYAPDENMRKEIYASIINADEDVLKNMPPALIVTAENDVLRSDGEIFARKLNKAGVKTSCVRINNTIHDFMMIDDLKNSPATQTAINLAVATLNDILNKQ